MNLKKFPQAKSVAACCIRLIVNVQSHIAATIEKTIQRETITCLHDNYNKATHVFYVVW